MRFSTGAVLLVVALLAGVDQIFAKKAPRSAASSRRGSSGRGPSRQSLSSSRRPPISKRRTEIYEDDEDGYDMGYEDPLDDEEDAYEEDEIDVESEEEEEDNRPKRKSSSSRGGRSSLRKSASRRSNTYDDEDENEDPPPRRPSNRRGSPGRGRGGPPRGRRGPGRGNRMVPYTNRRQEPSTFSRGLTALRSSMPDPNSVKEAAMKSLSVARETTSGLSANLYRDLKGLTSSELEQVMLKATRPDDTPVKGKHAERLVGVTYQISARYDIYDAVLRKLWAKMAEKDWRTTIKALYILHRFAADGSPEHAAALKVSLGVFLFNFDCAISDASCGLPASSISSSFLHVSLAPFILCNCSRIKTTNQNIRLVYANFVVHVIRNEKANSLVLSCFKPAIILKKPLNTVPLWVGMLTTSFFELSVLEACLTKLLLLHQLKTTRKRKLHRSPLLRHH
jgi:hypothetical protein